MTDAGPVPIFEAVIVPHRSLSRRARWLLTGLIGLACAISMAVFVTIGAWPVGGFAGLELLLAAYLIGLNARAARASEILLLSSNGMTITRTDPAGGRLEQRLPAAWLNVVLEERQGRVPALILVSHGLRAEVAASLGEVEKRDLAEALRTALDRWRSPTFDNPQLRD